VVETREQIFKVGGLWDEGNGREIEHNLLQIDGVEEVRASTAEGSVYVRHDPAVVSREFLERTLNSPGYSPCVR